MRFSTRLPADLRPNRLARAAERERAAGKPILDLTLSNPTQAELIYPPGLLQDLGSPSGLVYSPEPLGLLRAREAVSADYERRGLSVPPDRVVLTSSTSEAYSLLFKVLCDPGDEVLVPRPSYPLFDHLTSLEGVVARSYDIGYHGAWSIDLDLVTRACTDRTRAVLAVSPNNPTGSFVTPAELDSVATICTSVGAAVIVDEVFADYELRTGAAATAARIMDRDDVLAMSLGGLSKSIGLPQVKLAWMAVAGPEPMVAEMLSRLELASDTYLSVSTMVQAAAAGLFEKGAAVREGIRRRVTHNHADLVARARDVAACQVLNADGGWYAVVRIPTFVSEEDFVLRLLSDDGVLVHPGYFFDFPTESYCIVSLIQAEREFSEGVERLLRRAMSPDEPPRPRSAVRQ